MVSIFVLTAYWSITKILMFDLLSGLDQVNSLISSGALVHQVHP
jgi:hypothetical protein